MRRLEQKALEPDDVSFLASYKSFQVESFILPFSLRFLFSSSSSSSSHIFLFLSLFCLLFWFLFWFSFIGISFEAPSNAVFQPIFRFDGS